MNGSGKMQIINNFYDMKVEKALKKCRCRFCDGIMLKGDKRVTGFLNWSGFFHRNCAIIAL